MKEELEFASVTFQEPVNLIFDLTAGIPTETTPPLRSKEAVNGKFRSYHHWLLQQIHSMKEYSCLDGPLDAEVASQRQILINQLNGQLQRLESIKSNIWKKRFNLGQSEQARIIGFPSIFDTSKAIFFLA